MNYIPTTVDVSKQIEEIMDNFDFEKVRKCMKALGWNWETCHNGTPEVRDLRRGARKVLTAAAEKKNNVVGCGGFWAENDQDNCLTLRFVVEEWNGYECFNEETLFTNTSEENAAK